MQTKKRISGRKATREHASSKVLRGQKKVSENLQAGEKKAKELITSSTRKQKSVGLLSKKNGESMAATNSNTKYVSLHEEISNASLGSVTVKDASLGQNGFEEGNAPNSGTIFSPSFHLSKVSGVDIVKAGSCGMGDKDTASQMLDAQNPYDQLLTLDTNSIDSHCNLDSVSAIYLAMKSSKLECVDEHGQDSMTANVCVEDEEYEEFEDFDPYLFIKNLPDLSSVVPTFRPVLLPKQTRSCPPTTLVLDLDETLVHSTLEPCEDADFTFPVNFNEEEHIVYVRCRPYLREFMERVSIMFEIMIFTASQSIYAEQLLNVLDPKRKFFRHRVYRDSCVFVAGNYLKDLSVLGRDLARVIIVDNSPQAFGFQVDNGVPIESWFDDRSDKELLLLLPFLESLVGVEDVRPLIAKKFNLRGKIAAAVYPPSTNNVEDPFERRNK